MEEVYALADRVSVLRDGSHIGSLTRAELSADRLIRMMVGRDLSSFYTKSHSYSDTRKILEVKNVSDGLFVKNCSFDLHAGEVLGLAGLIGAGRTELARLIFGADRRATGEVILGGAVIPAQDPQRSIEAGLVYLTEDRKGLGLILDMSVAQNVCLMVLDEDSRWGLFNRAAARRRTGAAISALGIRAPHERINVGALSGGNQQKALLSRLLETRPRVLILDEPTRGVDVGAKSEIYRLIDQLAKSGMGLIVISSELPEIVGVADRVLVMRAGRIVGALDRTSISQEAIMDLATGVAAGVAA
jgi:ribose transport system ATP-binding protein